LPAQGTKIECTEHFDNSKDNPENPDPTKTVIWGQQSTDEMMVCMFNVAFPASMPAKELLSGQKPTKPIKPPPPSRASNRAHVHNERGSPS